MVQKHKSGTLVVQRVAALTLHFSQPQRLVVMLGRYGESVEEHQDDDQPIKRHRFDGQTTLPAAEPVPAAPAPTGGGGARMITGLKNNENYRRKSSSRKSLYSNKVYTDLNFDFEIF